MTDDYDPSARLSYSALTLHRTCPQAWTYRYVRGLDKAYTEPPVHLDFGHWWHALRASSGLIRGHEGGTLRYSPPKIGTAEDGPVLRKVDRDEEAGVKYRLPDGRTITPDPDQVLDLAEDYWRTVPAEDREVWVERLGEDLPQRLENLSARWEERWADDLAHEAPLGVEVRFQRTLNGSSAVIPGVADEVYRDERRNLTVARDYKSSNSLSSTETAENLSDSQLHLYAWGVAPIVASWGFKVQALAYDRARSTAPKQPKITQSGGLSKSVTDYDLHTYLSWAAGPDGEGVPWGEEGSYVKSGKREGEPKWGRYTAEDTVVERLSTPAAQSAWFQRTLVPVNTNVIRTHLQSALDTHRSAQETLRRYEEHGDAPRNFTRMGCRFCPYADLCRAEMMGGPEGEYPLADFGLVQQRH